MKFEDIMKMVGLVTELIPVVSNLIAHARQSGDLTADQKTALDDAIKGTALDPAWQPQDPA